MGSRRSFGRGHLLARECRRQSEGRLAVCRQAEARGCCVHVVCYAEWAADEAGAGGCRPDLEYRMDGMRASSVQCAAWGEGDVVFDVAWGAACREVQ
jgi:hypothetical protein